jgi:hypothetical protein
MNMTPVEIVQRQLEAYNARDLAAFVAMYSDDIRIFRMPASEPAISGKADFSAFYAEKRFNLPDLHAELLGRIATGNKVVDHERIRGISANLVEAIAVYQVGTGRIETVWFFAPQ